MPVLLALLLNGGRSASLSLDEALRLRHRFLPVSARPQALTGRFALALLYFFVVVKQGTRDGIMPQEVKAFSLDEVGKHSKTGDLWVVIDTFVYDLSRFAPIHPGGISVLLDDTVAGKDATKAFFGLHRQEVLDRPQYRRLRIGIVEGASASVVDRSALSGGGLDRVPHAEPTWLSNGFHSPYFDESHRKFHQAIRKFVRNVVYPDAQKHEEDGKPPSKEIIQAMVDTNVLAMRLGMGRHLKGRVLLNGIVNPEEFDIFHEMILWQEFSYLHARGYNDGLAAGDCIGNDYLDHVYSVSLTSLPTGSSRSPSSAELREKDTPGRYCGGRFVRKEIYMSCCVRTLRRKRCCRHKMFSKANRRRLGGEWDKWITNGMYADYFTTACINQDTRALMVLVVKRGDGVTTKLIKTSYSTAAGTALVTFDEVFVPDDWVISESDGLKIILSNFNHERWVLTTSSIGWQRAILGECLKWVNQRQVFGRPLSSQAVVRSKLASIISRVESCQNWLENITYQMKNMSFTQQATELAGQVAFLKMYATRSAQDTARDAVQIFGGRGLTKSGMGKHIEHYHRSLLIDAVGGGAEDIMADLGVRQALRKMPKSARL